MRLILLTYLFEGLLLRYFEGLLKDLQFKSTLFHTNRYYTII